RGLERQAAVLHQPERRRGDERLRHARDPEPRAGREWLRGLEVRDAGSDLDVDAGSGRDHMQQPGRHRRPAFEVALAQRAETILEIRRRGRSDRQAFEPGNWSCSVSSQTVEPFSDSTLNWYS